MATDATLRILTELGQQVSGLMQRVEQLETENADLKAENADLKAENKDLRELLNDQQLVAGFVQI